MSLDSAQYEDGELRLIGRVGIRQIAELHQAATAALAAPGGVAILLDSTDHLDTAAIQVLLALRIELEARGRELRVTPPGTNLDAYLGLSGVRDALLTGSA